MAVIIKKDEKINNVVNDLPANYTEQEFIIKFKEQYPNDWNKIVKSYNDHIRKSKPGKKIPMPQPEQYLTNALKVWIKKNKSHE